MSQLTAIVDPNDGAMPIEVVTMHEGVKAWACVRFNRLLAKDPQKAELALTNALGRRGLCLRGIMGGYHAEIVTDFHSSEEVIQYLQSVGAA